jgi:hypothetical protein
VRVPLQPLQRSLQQILRISAAAGQRERSAHEMLPALAEQPLQAPAVPIPFHATHLPPSPAKDD